MCAAETGRLGSSLSQVAPVSVAFILVFCFPFGVSQVVCGTRFCLLVLWAKRLVWQWMLHWVVSRWQHSMWTVSLHPHINAEDKAGHVVKRVF